MSHAIGMSAGLQRRRGAGEMDFNINHNVYVKLTDEGRRLHRKAHDELHDHIRTVTPKHLTAYPYEYHPPAEDEDGWSKWQLWELMASFGAHMHNGCTVPFELNIRIPGRVEGNFPP